VSQSIPTNGMARFNLSCAQAMLLAARLIDCLEENNQDATEVPPAYDYIEEFAHIIAKGLGIPLAIAGEGLGVCSV
jgi:hypothetical protein